MIVRKVSKYRDFEIQSANLTIIRGVSGNFHYYSLYPRFRHISENFVQRYRVRRSERGLQVFVRIKHAERAYKPALYAGVHQYRSYKVRYGGFSVGTRYAYKPHFL